jgi:hypothetical protein
LSHLLERHASLKPSGGERPKLFPVVNAGWVDWNAVLTLEKFSPSCNVCGLFVVVSGLARGEYL